jgi:serine/threonine-protein kinase
MPSSSQDIMGTLGQELMAPTIPPASPVMVREQLAKILASPVLAGSSRLRELLSFIVERTLEERSDELKEYALGVQVFCRPPSFDPRLDPIVRVQASNLRAKLKVFYAEVGLKDPVLIEVPKSVAVLPCADLSPAKDQEYFCDGITEELINALASVEAVRVIGRTSVFRFKGEMKDARDIGALLGVQEVTGKPQFPPQRQPDSSDGPPDRRRDWLRAVVQDLQFPTAESVRRPGRNSQIHHQSTSR